MTFKERLQKECQKNNVEDIIDRKCPYFYDYEKVHNCIIKENGQVQTCEECWDREIPESSGLSANEPVTQNENGGTQKGRNGRKQRLQSRKALYQEEGRKE